MSAPQPVAQLAAAPMRVTIIGRIAQVRKHEGARYTVITCAAPDPYSHPVTVEVRSKGELGAKDEETTVRCLLGGWSRRFKYTERDTGEVKQGTRYELALTAIE